MSDNRFYINRLQAFKKNKPDSSDIYYKHIILGLLSSQALSHILEVRLNLSHCRLRFPIPLFFVKVQGQSPAGF